MIEVLAVLVIIGILVTLVSRRVRGMGDDTRMIVALNTMKAVSEAVREFYYDLGFIPEEVDRVIINADSENDKRNQNPEYATRFLCLEKDCGDEKIQEYMEDQFLDYPDILEDGHAGCYDMAVCLRDFLGESTHSTVLEQLLHDPFFEKGWRGRYVSSNAFFNATEWDPDTYPADSEGNPVYLPVIATPWAQEIEEAAREAEKTKAPALAQEYRRGKYYQIWVNTTFECVDRRGVGNCMKWEWKQAPDTARIVCHGANGRDDGGTQYPVPDDIGDDMVMFIFGNGPVRSPLDD